MDVKTKNIEFILVNAGLKLTSNRKSILNLFIEIPFALSYNDIVHKLVEKIDKVTVYRTLKTFEEKNIIHAVYDHTNTVKYALSQDCCVNDGNILDHAHFRCNSCKQTFCVEGVSLPSIELPDGYSISQSSLLLEGVCQDCNK